MLWNTLIAKIDTFIDLHPEHPGVQVLLTQARASGKDVGHFLARIDIRKVGVLRDLVPEAFPRPLRNRKRLLRLDETTSGKWRVGLQ